MRVRELTQTILKNKAVSRSWQTAESGIGEVGCARNYKVIVHDVTVSELDTFGSCLPDLRAYSAANGKTEKCSFVPISAERVEDEYGNEYALITCCEENTDQGSASYAGSVQVDIFVDAILALPAYLPVYLLIQGASDGDERVFAKAECASNCSMGSGYVTSICAVKADEIKVGKKDKKLLLFSTVLQNGIWCLGAWMLSLFFVLPSPQEIGLGEISTFIFNYGYWIGIIGAVFVTTALLCIFACLYGMSCRFILGKDKKMQIDKKSRQGVIGEVMQLPLTFNVPFFLITGIGEEAAFRFGLVAILYAIALNVFDAIAAIMIASIISNVVFTLLHISGNQNVSSLMGIFAIGAILTLSFLMTGSLIVAMLAHGAYDLCVAVSQGRCMRRKGKAKYFFGKRPVNIIHDKENGYVICR